jgi:MFS family permease
MIAFRGLQGAFGASMIPIVFTSSLYYFQGPRRVYSAAVVGTIASVAPTLGPIIGGLDHRHVELALAFLRQSRARHSDHAFGPAPRRHRQAGSAPS